MGASSWTVDTLLAFEADIAEEFAKGAIRAPVHLSGGNEQVLIDIFRAISRDDWVLGGWRSHYHCLLKGVPPDELKAAILAGRSISSTFPSHRILCSGIAGGVAPIAVGLAWAIKKNAAADRVWCFIGDMTAQMGVVREAMDYAANFHLPVSWVIEDNGRSVGTDTRASWGVSTRDGVDTARRLPNVMRYDYELGRPHVGIGQWVEF